MRSDRLEPAEITGGPGKKGRGLSMFDILHWEKLSQGNQAWE